ncbi:hypothetical protein NTHI1209_00329 [Haemophilus influenzae]|uniref:Uncharacterized protein n=1 Tax=Haemophilus influenzae TaxID=727 RepID=A0A158SV33_HAEIF|nr:hypothetical protein NTHI1209_00329 [Haemophilus influenzae]
MYKKRDSLASVGLLEWTVKNESAIFQTIYLSFIPLINL